MAYDTVHNENPPTRQPVAADYSDITVSSCYDVVGEDHSIKARNKVALCSPPRDDYDDIIPSNKVAVCSPPRDNYDDVILSNYDVIREEPTLQSTGNANGYGKPPVSLPPTVETKAEVLEYSSVGADVAVVQEEVAYHQLVHQLSASASASAAKPTQLLEYYSKLNDAR